MKEPCVYLLASKKNGTIYTGVTSNLPTRISQHKQIEGSRFTSKHQCHYLVYYEPHATMENAVIREKQIKAGSRKDKIALIEKDNSGWNDLFDSLM